MTDHERDHDAAGPSGPGSVVLDIGPGTGALVLFTPACMLGAEIDISSVGQAAHRSHSQVRQRVSERQPGGSEPDVSYAAVYPSLAAGRYVIWRDAEIPAGTITIAGAKVTTWHWPAAAERVTPGLAITD
jgi:hypothetical protein